MTKFNIKVFIIAHFESKQYMLNGRYLDKFEMKTKKTKFLQVFVS